MSLHFKQKIQAMNTGTQCQRLPCSLTKPTQWWKNNSKNSQIKKTHSRLYILILFYLKGCIYIVFFHPANIYWVITLFRQCARCWEYIGEKRWILCLHVTGSSEKTHGEHTFQWCEAFRGGNVIGNRPRGLSSYRLTMVAKPHAGKWQGQSPNSVLLNPAPVPCQLIGFLCGSVHMQVIN